MRLSKGREKGTARSAEGEREKGQTGSILIKNCMRVALMDAARTEISGGDIFIEGNRITAVGKNLKHKAARTIDARGMVATPGFVNTHHHLYQTFQRNVPYVQNAELFDWLVSLYEIWREVTPEIVYTSALVGLGELLLTGCTTTTDHFYVFPKKTKPALLDEEIRAAAKIGIRFHPTRGSMSRGRSMGGLPPDDVVQKEDEILKDCDRVIARYHDPSPDSMCRVGLAPCSPFSVTTELLKETAAFARKKGVRLHTHLAETKDEEAFCVKTHGVRPFEYMEQVGWVGPDVWYAHAIFLNDREIKRMAETGTGAAHCPASNQRLGSGIAPIPKMLAAGVPVGLGVDGSASNDGSDMLGELRSALLLHRVLGGASAITADDVFRMATAGGAKILGFTDVGSIEAGKLADVVLWDMNQLGYAGSMHDPVAALLFSGDCHMAHTVIVNGRVVVSEGRLTRIDEDRLIGKANRLAAAQVRRAALRTGVDYSSRKIWKKGG
ncbi:8-oxoguanine deaminase [bacterium]|nr:8-oxoguanine deaminase [bacterium]